MHIKLVISTITSKQGTYFRMKFKNNKSNTSSRDGQVVGSMDHGTFASRLFARAPRPGITSPKADGLNVITPNTSSADAQASHITPKISPVHPGSKRVEIVGMLRPVLILIVVIGVVGGVIFATRFLAGRNATKSVDEPAAVQKSVSYEESVAGVSNDEPRYKPTNTNEDFLKYFGQAIAKMEDQDFAAAVVLFEKADAAPGNKPSDFYAQMAAAYKAAGNSSRATESIKKAKDTYVKYESSGVHSSEKNAVIAGYDFLIKEYAK